MAQEYSTKEIWELYEGLPKELQEVIFSEATAEHIGNICERNKVEDKKIPEVARLTGRTLLGLLPPNEFEKELEKKLELEPEVAKSVAQEIFRFVFFPVKALLEELYRTEIEPPAKPTTIPDQMIETEITPPLKEKSAVERKMMEEKPKTSKKDIYREPIE